MPALDGLNSDSNQGRLSVILAKACVTRRDTTTIPLNLKGNESTIVAFDRSNALGRDADFKVHATSSGNAIVTYNRDGKLAVKATSGGRYNIKLSNGLEKNVHVSDVPSPLKLGNWKLKVEEWEPGSTPTETSKDIVNVDLGDLKPWSAVPSLQFSSGIGTYTTTFEMVKGSSDGVGAYLDLGIVNFGYRLRINGREVKASQTNTVIDIGPYVTAGNNTVEVQVATSLNNRRKNLYNIAGRAVDYYGLLGSGGTSAMDGLGGAVTVTPYVETVIQ